MLKSILKYGGKSLLILLVLVRVNVLYSFPPDLKFRNISTANGLSHNIVTSILKDYKGFIWIGTNGSLNKYNGYSFTKYEKNYNDSNSISNNIINCIFEDKDKQLWIGTLNGLNLYNRKYDNFTRFIYDSKNPSSISANPINTIYQDREGNLWIGTIGGGLNLYNPKTRTFKRFRHNAQNLHSISHDIITSITEDTLGNLWVGTMRGLNILTDKKEGYFITYASNDDPALIYENNITQLKTDKKGNIWVGTNQKGIYRIKKENNKFTLIPIADIKAPIPNLNQATVLSIFADDDNLLWIGTENHGLFLYDYQTGALANYKNHPDDEESLSNNSIWHIYRSNDQIIWLSSYNKGIDYYDPNFSQFNGIKTSRIKKTLSSNNITGFSEDNLGNIWITTDGGGLNYWNRKNNQFTWYNTTNKALPVDATMCVLVDSKGGVWCGTWGGGLSYMKKGGKFIQFERSEREGYLSGNNIVSLSEDKKGRIWIGTIGSGIFYYEPKTQKFTRINNDNGNILYTNIWDQYHANDGSIWLCTSTGVFVLKETTPGKFTTKQYTHDPLKNNSLSDNQTRSVYQDNKGTIWIGTDGGGLNLYEPKNEIFARILKNQGLPDNSIKSIIGDLSGNLWLATNKGLCKYHSNKDKIEYFDFNDGLYSDLITQGTLLLTKNGEIFLGSYNGVNYFHPQKIKKNPNAPPVYIVDLKVNNEYVKVGSDSPLEYSITETKTFTLNHKQNVFSLDFASLNYSHPEKNQYAYYLEGFDTKWNYVGNSHAATYTNLKPGKYNFKVLGSNNHGVWNTIPASIEIIILPPFWKSKLALILYFIFILGIIYYYISFKIKRSREKDMIKLEHLRIEHEEELYKNKLRFLTNVSHELRTPLSLMMSPLEQIVSNENFPATAKNKLKLVYRNTQRLFRLVDELMDFSRIENQKTDLNPINANIIQYLNNVKDYFSDLAYERKMNFSFEYDSDPIFISFDRDKLDKVFFNLLLNAFKFTPDGGTIKILLSTFKKETPEWTFELEKIPEFKNKNLPFICIAVTDTGIGISKEHQEKIFESFYQVNDSRLNTSGTGIGLALAKSIVELHGGKIQLISEIGNGSTFKVYLPIEQINTTNKNIKSEKINKRVLPIIKHTEFEAFDTIEENPEEVKRKKFSILLVEDNRELRKYLKTELESEFKVIEAKSGNSGFESILKKQPDLVLSDIIMSDGDGLELCSKIKNNEKLNHIPVVLLTAKNTSADKLLGIESGADAYITKPFNISILKAQINQILINRNNIISKLTSPSQVNMNPSITSIDQQFIESFKIVVLDKISDPDLSVEFIASELNLSRSQVYRKVKNITSMSPNDYIKSIRMDTAKKILETQAVTINEVSIQVGFTSPSYFTKCFKDTFNMLPLDVVNKKRQN